MHHGGTALLDPFALLERAGLDQGFHVADFGCGSLGHFIFPAASIVGGSGRVYAVDILKTALDAITRKARQHQYFNIHPVWSDIERVEATRIPPRSLDLALLVASLGSLSNREGVMQEVHRLLKPGGAFLIIEWKPEERVLGPQQEYRISLDELRVHVGEDRFHEEEAFDAGDAHYGLLLRRAPGEFDSDVLHISHPLISH